MNDNLNMIQETPESGESAGRANPSYYINRKSATILMIIKLAEGLSELCIAILGAFVLNSVVSALNRIFQEGSTVSDGKAMVAQFLKTLRVPPETIREVIDAFPLNINFSAKPFMYVFALFLPFVVIAVLEAIAAIRLRLGKGGTRTIGILQMIYYVLGIIRLILFVLMAIVLSIMTIVSVGGTPSIILAAVLVSLAIFFTLLELPRLFYHRNISRLMNDVRYEMQTGNRAARRKTRFQLILNILIVLEVIGVIVSVAASWGPMAGGTGAAMIAGTMIGPAAKLLKYICVKCSYRNFMADGSAAQEVRSVSHTPLIILIVLATLFFAIPNIFLCMQSSRFSSAIVDRVEEFFSQARQTVNEVSVEAEKQIDAVQSAIEDQAKVLEDASSQDSTKEEGTGTSASAQDSTKEEGAGTSASAQDGTKEEGAGTSASAQDGIKEESTGTSASAQGNVKEV